MISVPSLIAQATPLSLAPLYPILSTLRHPLQSYFFYYCLSYYLYIYFFFMFIFLLILQLLIGCTLLQTRGMGRWCVGVLWSVLILFPSCKVLNDNQSQLPSLGDNVDHEVDIDLWRGLQVVFSHSTNITNPPAEKKKTDIEGTEYRWRIEHGSIYSNRTSVVRSAFLVSI